MSKSHMEKAKDYENKPNETHKVQLLKYIYYSILVNSVFALIVKFRLKKIDR
jgi:hypothetical protein